MKQPHPYGVFTLCPSSPFPPTIDTLISLARQRKRRESKRVHGWLRNYLTAVANTQEYIERLKLTVEHLHKCSALHLGSVPVTARFRGAREKVVEVFHVTGHPKATLVYAWSHLGGADDSDERFVAVPGVPPVDSPLRAVQVSIAAEAKKLKH